MEQEQSATRWIAAERRRAVGWMLENISPPGAAKGAVAASQQRANPNYWYHWVRDASLTMMVIADLYRRYAVAYRHARSEDERRTMAAERQRYFGLLLDFTHLSRRQQQSDAPAGLGEPKFEMDGTPYRQPWGRPQNDSPAARAIALAHFAQTLLMEHQDKLVRELLYRAELPPGTAVKADLEYVAHHWGDLSFDAWEEVAARSHFYNAMVQRRALLDGAHLAAALNDRAAARFYREQAALLEKRIEKHWREDLGLLVPSLDSAGNPGRDGGLDYKRANIDSLVIIGIVRGDTADAFMTPIDDRALATVARQEAAFRGLYPINKRPGIPGLGIGRYPEDRWFGGNPWMICTLAFAEYYYLAIKRYRAASEITVTARSLPFFAALGLPFSPAAGMKLSRGDERFRAVMCALRAKGDAYVERVRYHADRRDGSWAEEMDRDSGYKVSAEKLTWNSAAYLRVLDNRREALDVDVMIPAAVAQLGWPITTSLERIHFVFEGAGDVVRRYWGPALLKLRSLYPDRPVRVTLLDVSDSWRGDPVREAKGRAMLEQFKASGFEYFDKSKYKGDQKGLDAALRALEPDVVVVANPDFAHVATVRDWLRRYGDAPPQILVEKPFSNKTEDAFMLLGELAGRRPDQVHLVDHFRAMSLMMPEDKAKVFAHLGGRAETFRFWLVEDHSGSDPRYQSVIAEDGAIEREGRDKTLKEGLIYDLMPHMFAVAELVGDVLTFFPKWIRAAQYVGVGGDPQARPRIPADAETFADVGFSFHGRDGAPIQGQAVMGKGLSGVRELGPTFDHEVFAWELSGVNGRRVLFNLRADGAGSGRAHLLDAHGAEVDSFALSTEQPYLPIVESVFNGVYLMNRVVLPPSFGFGVLQIMDDVRLPIKRHEAPLPTYAGGMRGGRPSAYVEDLAGLEPVWGSMRSVSDGDAG